MQRNWCMMQQFEDNQIRSQVPDYFRNLRIVEALLAEARALGVFPLRDPLDGIDVDIRVAEVMRVHGLAGEDRARAG
ncbi:MAG: hypothetical protein H5T65_13680 [Chloroflexi bacterium]|nr:hypothetical protein [Chloroflexota bacterium]